VPRPDKGDKQTFEVSSFFPGNGADEDGDEEDEPPCVCGSRLVAGMEIEAREERGMFVRKWRAEAVAAAAAAVDHPKGYTLPRRTATVTVRFVASGWVGLGWAGSWPSGDARVGSFH
jgi:hypothetical protein